MHPLVIEYRALPESTDHLPDGGLNDRKRVIINTLDTEANDKDVSALLLDVLRDLDEYDLARVEAIQVVGIYVDASSPICDELRREVIRIYEDDREDDMLKGWAERYVDRLRQA